MEVGDLGFFIEGDEFVETNIEEKRLVFGKTFACENETEVLDVHWNPHRKNCFSVDYVRDSDVKEYLSSLRRGLRNGPVRILDKQFKLGDLVELGDRRGEVVETSFVCAVFVPGTGAAPGKVILNLPIEQLRPISRFTQGERVIQDGWLGVIREVEWEAHLVSSNRERCTLLFKNGIWSANSYGSYKPYVMYSGQGIILTSEYTNQLKWEVMGKIHKFDWFIVSSVQVQSITVDWIIKIPQTPGITKPDPVVVTEKLVSVVQFESRGRNRLFQSFCRYVKELHEPDVLVVNEADWLTAFTDEIYGDNSRIQNLATVRILVGLDPAPGSDDSQPSKRMKVTSDDSDTEIKDVSGKSISIHVFNDIEDNAIVDIIFTQQIVHVNWENNQVHQILSRHLKRIEKIPNPISRFRSFIVPKNTAASNIHCGVTYRRDPFKETVQVQWFDLNKANRLELIDDIVNQSTYDIQPHPKYELIRIGAFVTRSVNNTKPSRFSYYGIIRGIHRNGRVEVCCETPETKSRFRAWPSQLQVVPHLYFPTSSTSGRFKSSRTRTHGQHSLTIQAEIARRDIVPPTQEKAYLTRCSDSQTTTIGNLKFPTFAILPTTDKP